MKLKFSIKFFILYILSIVFVIYSSLYLSNYSIIFYDIEVKDLAVIILWFLTTSLFAKFIAYLIISTLEKKQNRQLPTLVSDLVKLLLWLISIFLFFKLYFEKDLTAFWTTSGIAIAILGFALKSLVLDLFAGLTMGIERLFEIGDWIETGDGEVGKVISINWRVTKILTEDNYIKVVPNSSLSTVSFNNYGTKRMIRDKIEFDFDYDITAYRAERLLLSAANIIPSIYNGHERPEIFISNLGDDKITWELRYWVDDYALKDKYKLQIKKNILKNLHFSGLKISKECVDIKFILRQMPLFGNLTEDELELIAQKANRKLHRKDKNVININEEGNSLFILQEGLLSVLIPAKDEGVMMEVAKIAPGDFFGEMSLLTGERRSATIKTDVDSIIYEINQDALKPILSSRTELAEHLSEYLTNRQLANQSKIKNNEEELKRQKEKKKNYIFNSIKSIFLLKG